MPPKEQEYLSFQVKGAADLVKKAVLSYKKALEDAYTGKVNGDNTLGVLQSKLTYARSILFNQMTQIEDIVLKYYAYNNGK